VDCGGLWWTVVDCGGLWWTVVDCVWCTACGVLRVVQLGVSITIGHSIQIQRVAVEVVVTRAIFVHLLV
jgi:hypothetical protein